MLTAKLLGKLVLSFLTLAIITNTVSCVPSSKKEDNELETTPRSAPIFTFNILNTYTHNRDAFTQGLAFANGLLYEGTGLYDKSSLRNVDLKTGDILQIHTLPYEYFGEGITVFKDSIIQLT